VRQIHQIELELQNEELMKLRAQVEEGPALCAELYDFPPAAIQALTAMG
jgi:hypothetical protein